MKRFLTLGITFLVSASLVGCADASHQDVGTVTGAVAGGLLGSTVGGGSGQILAIAAGTLAGAYIGGSIGQHMDQQDQMRMNEALDNNNAGQPAYWRNSQTNASYQVTPVKNVRVDGNKYCREYRTTADIAGKKQQMYGTACRQPDGSWKVVK